MKKNEQFFAQLQALLVAYPHMLYDDGSSESSGEKITAVRLPWHKTLRWRGEKDGMAEQRLDSFLAGNNDADGPKRLHELLQSFPYRVSYKRNTNGDYRTDLYILVPFGWWSVGIRTTLIYT